MKVLEDIVTTGAFLAGLGLIAYGAWLIAQPVGIIVGGLEALLVVTLYARGSPPSDDAPTESDAGADF